MLGLRAHRRRGTAQTDIEPGSVGKRLGRSFQAARLERRLGARPQAPCLPLRLSAADLHAGGSGLHRCAGGARPGRHAQQHLHQLFARGHAEQRPHGAQWQRVPVTPGRVTILGENDGSRLRRIYTDGRSHPDDPDLTFNGHSIGHWEGDTLIVDTVAILPQVFLPLGQAVGIPNNGDMHIVERIRLAGPDRLEDAIEIEAPKVLTAPWRVTKSLVRSRNRNDDISEASCHQGDFYEAVDANSNHVFLPIKQDASGARLPTGRK